jgi:hypothetical protein
MNEEQSNIPQTLTADELALQEIRPYLLDAREDYPEPYYMFEYNGVPFSAIGGIQAITGQKKNGKTFVLSMMMAVVLAPDAPRVHANLPGLTVPQRTLNYLGHLPKVLYVDTEMERLNSAKVLRRVLWLIGHEMDQPHERFYVLSLRTIEATDTEPSWTRRKRLIKLAMDVLKPDIVFIDGVRDIIGDFNDNQQSSALVQELMADAEKRGICIWNVLHLNPRPGNDDESKMRGHLGTELGNKVTDTLASIKQKKGSTVTFTVKQLDDRGKDLDDWQFEVTNEAGNLGIPRIISGGAVEPKVDTSKCDDPEKIREWISIAKDRLTWPMSRKDIKERVFKEIGLVTNKEQQQTDLIAAINLGYFEETTLKSNGYPLLQPKDEMPF